MRGKMLQKVVDVRYSELEQFCRRNTCKSGDRSSVTINAYKYIAFNPFRIFLKHLITWCIVQLFGVGNVFVGMCESLYSEMAASSFGVPDKEVTYLINHTIRKTRETLRRRNAACAGLFA